MKINLFGRHFLTLQDYAPDEITYLLDLSASLKVKKKNGIVGNILAGKNIVLLFEKPSTRTRCAFEVAAFDEGAQVTCLTNSHFGKKESVEDSAKVFGRYYDGIEFRGFKQETAELLAKHAGIPVWNGLTDEDHPTQALADILTIKEHVAKPLNQIKVVYVGDGRNNVSNALMIACAKLGMTFTISAPEALHPDNNLLSNMQTVAKKTGASISIDSNPVTAVKNADVIYTDVWVSMGEETQFVNRIKLLKPYQVTMELLHQTNNPHVIFMHCLPAYHDTETEIGEKIAKEFGLTSMEVTDDVFRSKHSVVFDQAENRLHTIKAVMIATMKNKVD